MKHRHRKQQPTKLLSGHNKIVAADADGVAADAGLPGNAAIPAIHQQLIKVIRMHSQAILYNNRLALRTRLINLYSRHLARMRQLSPYSHRHPIRM